jgi:hypothetical protein
VAQKTRLPGDAFASSWFAVAMQTHTIPPSHKPP